MKVLLFKCHAFPGVANGLKWHFNGAFQVISPLTIALHQNYLIRHTHRTFQYNLSEKVVKSLFPTYCILQQTQSSRTFTWGFKMQSNSTINVGHWRNIYQSSKSRSQLVDWFIQLSKNKSASFCLFLKGHIFLSHYPLGMSFDYFIRSCYSKHSVGLCDCRPVKPPSLLWDTLDAYHTTLGCRGHNIKVGD